MAASDITATERAEPVAWIEHHKGGDNLVWDPQKNGLRYSPLYLSTSPSQAQGETVCPGCGERPAGLCAECRLTASHALASPPSAPAPAASEWEIDHRADALANAVIAGTDHISNLTAALHTEQDRTHRYLARAEQAEAALAAAKADGEKVREALREFVACADADPVIAMRIPGLRWHDTLKQAQAALAATERTEGGK